MVEQENIEARGSPLLLKISLDGKDILGRSMNGAKTHHELGDCGIVVCTVGGVFEPLDSIVELVCLLTLSQESSFLTAPLVQDSTDYFSRIFHQGSSSGATRNEPVSE